MYHLMQTYKTSPSNLIFINQKRKAPCIVQSVQYCGIDGLLVKQRNKNCICNKPSDFECTPTFSTLVGNTFEGILCPKMIERELQAGQTFFEALLTVSPLTHMHKQVRLLYSSLPLTDQLTHRVKFSLGLLMPQQPLPFCHE